jgi:rhodanese-related sulfurtransferase
MSASAALQAHMHRRYTREELRRRLHDPGLAIVNALPESSWEEVRIAGSRSLPLADVQERARILFPDLDQEIVFYCGGPT